MRFRKTAALSLFLVSMAGAAQAATIAFNTSNGWTTGGLSFGPVTVYGATVDTNGRILDNGHRVASWSGSSGGLGICRRDRSCVYGSSESGSQDRHTIDGGDGREVALLDFGALNVEITSVTFSYWDSSDEYDVGIYGSTGVGTSPSFWSEDRDTSGNPSIKTFTFAPGFLTGSIIGFGADHSSDEFKLKALQYNVLAQVPLPAGGALMLAALAGLVGLRRRARFVTS